MSLQSVDDEVFQGALGNVVHSIGVAPIFHVSVRGKWVNHDFFFGFAKGNGKEEVQIFG